MNKRLLPLGLTLLLAACSQAPMVPSANIIQNRLQTPGLTTFGSGLKTLRPNLPKGTTPRQTVLLSYLPIDDGLDFHIPFYLNTLERTTSNRIYNVAFTDANGPNNTFAHLIQPDKTNKVISASSFPSPTVKEMSTNHPDNLASVVSWAYSSYPAQFKVFSYLGHGGGYMGIATDNTPGTLHPERRSMLAVHEFSAALKKGLKGRKLDMIHLHACLMANVEAAYDLRGVTKVLFASEDVVGAHQEGTEKPTEIMNTMIQTPNPNAYNIAKRVAIQLNARRNPYGFETASAINIDRIHEVKQAINGLSKALMQAIPRHRQAIVQAYQSVPELKNFKNSGQRDLWTFTKNLMKVGDPQLTRQANGVIQSMNRALIHTRDGEGKAANGLSIHMPNRLGNVSPVYRQSRFAKDTGWDEFLIRLAQP